MSRPLVGMEEEPSQLERLCVACRAAVDAGSGMSESETDGESDSESDGDSGSEAGSGSSGAGFSRLSARSGRRRGGSSLADISEHGSLFSDEGASDSGVGGGGDGGGFDSRLQSLELSDDESDDAAAGGPPAGAASGGGSGYPGPGVLAQRLVSWNLRGGGGAAMPDMVSAGAGGQGGGGGAGLDRRSMSAAGSVARGDSTHGRSQSTATRLPSAGEDLLFELDDGGSGFAGGGGGKAPAPLGLARRHSSPVGSLELGGGLTLGPDGGLAAVSNGVGNDGGGPRRHSSGDLRLSPRTPAAHNSAAYAATAWPSSDPQSPEGSGGSGPASMAGSPHGGGPTFVSGSVFGGASIGGAESSAFCSSMYGGSAFSGASGFTPHGPPPSTWGGSGSRRGIGRPASAMGGFSTDSDAAFPFGGRGGRDGGQAAQQAPMAMSLALPSTVQRARPPRRLTHQRSHHHRHNKVRSCVAALTLLCLACACIPEPRLLACVVRSSTHLFHRSPCSFCNLTRGNRATSDSQLLCRTSSPSARRPQCTLRQSRAARLWPSTPCSPT